MFDKKEISLSSTSGVWIGWIPINTLVEEGIGMLKKQLAKWLAEYDDYTGESVQLMVVAASQPANTRLAMDFDLKINATIQYEYCLTTSKLIGTILSCCLVQIWNTPDAAASVCNDIKCRNRIERQRNSVYGNLHLTFWAK